MYYDDFKAMLKKKTSSFKTVDMSPEELAERAESFLETLSVRKYIGPVTVDSLFDDTELSVNPLAYFDVNLDKTDEDCRKANEKMRSLYGDISEKFYQEDYSIKEYIAWQAIFPERQKELSELVFHEEEDYGLCLTSAYGIVLRPAFCSMGDELSLPKAVAAVNASMVREIMDDESEEYEEKVRLVKLLVPGDPEEEEG